LKPRHEFNTYDFTLDEPEIKGNQQDEVLEKNASSLFDAEEPASTSAIAEDPFDFFNKSIPANPEKT